MGSFWHWPNKLVVSFLAFKSLRSQWSARRGWSISHRLPQASQDSDAPSAGRTPIFWAYLPGVPITIERRTNICQRRSWEGKRRGMSKACRSGLRLRCRSQGLRKNLGILVEPTAKISTLDCENGRIRGGARRCNHRLAHHRSEGGFC